MLSYRIWIHTHTQTGSEDEDQVVMEIMLLQPLVNHVIVSDLMSRLDLHLILIFLKHMSGLLISL